MQVLAPTIKLSLVPNYLKIATTEQEFQHIWQLRQAEYSSRYPAINYFKDDVYDANACVLYSQNKDGKYISTGRIVLDSVLGLPADELIKPEVDKLRQQGLIIAESSKFAINREARGALPWYFYTYCEICVAYGIDSLIFIIWDKNVGLYQKTAGAKVLVQDIGYHYGTAHKFSLLECRVQEVIPTFLQYWGRN